mgnify:CR=1 FL=1
MQHGIIASLGFNGRNVSDWLQKSAVIEPVDPFERREFDGFHRPPRSAPPDHFGFIEAVDRLHEGVIERIADGPDRRCDLLEREIATGERIVELTDELVVFCPYASRLPLEMCILPRRHAARFEENAAEGLAQLAHVLRSALVRLEGVLGRVAYNYIIATSPFDMLSNGHYHWRIEVLPRLTTTAGFEWGSGCYINPVPPEQAAAKRQGLMAPRSR